MGETARDAESEPKPFGKGAEDGDLGATSRAGRIRVLEGLIGALEDSIRPTQERIRALRGVVEQEREALFLEQRRAQRARERMPMDDQPSRPEALLTGRGGAALQPVADVSSTGDGKPVEHVSAS